MTADEIFRGIREGDIIDYVVLAKTDQGYRHFHMGDLVAMYGYMRLACEELRDKLLEARTHNP